LRPIRAIIDSAVYYRSRKQINAAAVTDVAAVKVSILSVKRVEV
jgi:Zn-dependent membrane protease YugP